MQKDKYKRFQAWAKLKHGSVLDWAVANFERYDQRMEELRRQALSREKECSEKAGCEI